MPVDLERFARLSKKIYDDYRTALMTQLYYGRRLTSLKRYNLWYEILLAVGTSGVIAGWYIFQIGPGRTAWAIFAGVVAILTTIKPILKLTEEIERLSKQNAGYRDVYFDLKQLVEDIENNACITDKMEEVLATTKSRAKNLVKEDDPGPNRSIVEACQKEVNRVIIEFVKWFPEIENRAQIREESNANKRKSS